MTISVSNLGKRFNREWIFRGLTQEFKPGNVYAIVGPNGSGKSTMLRTLWGQEPPSEGKIEYQSDGNLISSENIFNHISLATPYMDLIEELTLKEHVEFHFKFKKAVASLPIKDIIRKMDLEFAASKPIGQFSSGMKQRLKLGLAFFSRADILFLDEPTTHLDQRANDWYLNNLFEIKAEKLVFVATNQSSDYPKDSIELNISGFKQVTIRERISIQASLNH